jgi:hypothetical protein
MPGRDSIRALRQLDLVHQPPQRGVEVTLGLRLLDAIDDSLSVLQQKKIIGQRLETI